MKVKGNEALFNEWKRVQRRISDLQCRVDSLAAIVQNDQEVTMEEYYASYISLYTTQDELRSIDDDLFDVHLATMKYIARGDK
jgi:hypothetical protein